MDQLEQQDIFVAGDGGYHTYRIPALCVTKCGVMLAFCEARRDSFHDSGQIDLVLRRSADGGRTWGPMRVIVTEPDMTCGNPCPIADRETGAVVMPFCKNRADGPEGMIIEGQAPRTVWLTRSEDDGATWSEPVEITADVKRPEWTWYATGPCHGVQLASGRMVAPCDMVVGVQFDRKTDPRYSHVILSDDGGATWRIGGIVDPGTNECAVVETAPGELVINCRNSWNSCHVGERRRTVARSTDGGEHFGPAERDPALVEPVCQGSLVGLPDGAVAFANPASERRACMTVRLSLDACRTWPASRTLWAGPAAYSDLALAPDGAVCCLYERGDGGAYERLTLARFGRDWLAEGRDVV